MLVIGTCKIIQQDNRSDRKKTRRGTDSAQKGKQAINNIFFFKTSKGKNSIEPLYCVSL